jgi:hypothetical protein
MQTHIVDGVRLSHSRSGINLGARNQHAQTAFNEIGERFDRRRRDAIIAPYQWVLLSLNLHLCQRG